MKTITVRIIPKAYLILRRLAKLSGESTQVTLAKAIELYRRQDFLNKANTAFAGMRKDSKAWKEELKERHDWDATLPDGLDDLEY